MSLHFYKPNFRQTVWFTADTHAFHSNICRGTSTWTDTSGCRPFDNEVQMTETMADNINNLVASSDVLFCVGDWSFGPATNVEKFRDMLNCMHIIYITGNHSRAIHQDKDLQKLFEWVGHYNEFRFNKTLICQFHYAMSVWNQSHKGSIQLFGHSHGTFTPTMPRQMDVGIDTHPDFTPYNFENVFLELSKKPVYFPDHHDKNTN